MLGRVLVIGRVRQHTGLRTAGESGMRAETGSQLGLQASGSSAEQTCHGRGEDESFRIIVHIANLSVLEFQAGFPILSE
jgi:hypothetical protein